MTTKEQNERLTRVGPGTPMGELLRRYWQPIGVAIDSAPPPVASPIPWLLGVLAVSALALNWMAQAAEEPIPAKIEFNRDIRPILSDKCFFCHGFDEKKREAKLRLDVREDAIAKKAFIPGKPDQSALVKRIFTKDADDLMPPADSHKQLTAAQKELLKRWVAGSKPI